MSTRNPATYINHPNEGQEANCCFQVMDEDPGPHLADWQDFVKVVALCDIPKGEELLLHYGPGYWKPHEIINLKLGHPASGKPKNKTGVRVSNANKWLKRSSLSGQRRLKESLSTTEKEFMEKEAEGMPYHIFV